MRPDNSPRTHHFLNNFRFSYWSPVSHHYLLSSNRMMITMTIEKIVACRYRHRFMWTSRISILFRAKRKGIQSAGRFLFAELVFVTYGEFRKVRSNCMCNKQKLSNSKLEVQWHIKADCTTAYRQTALSGIEIILNHAVKKKVFKGIACLVLDKKIGTKPYGNFSFPS